MYASLLHPWTPTHLASTQEQQYRNSGLLRTKGTIFLHPPPPTTLVSTYNAPPRPKTRMSAGAVALCKHFERGGASSEHGRMHPYWVLPRGGNDEKSRVAGDVLRRLLGEVCWRNVLLLHPGVAVYEVRNSRGWGMRWTLDVVVDDDEKGSEGEGRGGGVVEDGVGGSGMLGGEGGGDAVRDEDDVANRNWRIVRTTFRGFLEPIEGMDHELDCPGDA